MKAVSRRYIKISFYLVKQTYPQYEHTIITLYEYQMKQLHSRNMGFVHFLKIRYAFTFASSINKNLFQTNWEGGCVFCYYAVVRLRNSSSSSSVSVSWFFWASSSTVLRCSVHCRNARKLELRKALTCVRHSSFLFYSLQFNHDQRTKVLMWLKYLNTGLQYYLASE